MKEIQRKRHHIATSPRLNETMESKRFRAAFSLLEILTVIAVISILTVATVAMVGGRHLAGTRQASADVVMQAVEQARQIAIALGVKSYIGLADSSYPDPQKRLRAYIIFRDYTDEEKAQMNPAPETGKFKAITRWNYLPKGFCFDANDSESLLQDDSTKANTIDLGVATGTASDVSLRVIAFDSLGQVVDTPAVKVPRIAVREAIYNSESQTLVYPPDSTASGFYIQVSRLTGRVQFKDSVASADTTGNQ